MGTESFRQIAEFLDRTHAGLLVVDSASTVIAWNEAVTDLLGIDGDPSEYDVSRIAPPTGAEIATAVEEAFRTGDIADFEVALDRGGSFEITVIPVEDAVALAVRDVSERVSMRRELQRSSRILETLDDGVFVLDEAFVITMVNDAVTAMTGYSREELVGSHASMLANSETISMADTIIERLRGEGSDIGVIESTIRTADGEDLPIETQFSTVEFASGRQQRVGIIRDLTDRLRSERTLRELNRSARRLLRADTDRAVYETIIDVAAAVWPDATLVVYSFDEVESVLEPVVASGDLPEPRGPGSTVWEEFLTGEDGVKIPDDRDDFAEPDDDDTMRPSGRVVERVEGDSTSPARTLYATLDEYGLLYVEVSGDPEVSNAKESVELLAANAVAALGRVEREAELSHQSDALTERNQTLRRLHDLNDLIRRVNAALVDADTLQEVGDAVCELLVDADPVQFAWFGETYLTGGDLEPIARGGRDEGYLDDLRFTAANGRDDSSEFRNEPTRRALDTAEVVAVPDVSKRLHESPWRERALVYGYRSVIAVPLAYNDLEYGVLSVYADRSGAFDAEFGELLVELGNTVADAINSIETRRSLRSESAVELEVHVDAPDALLVRIASALSEPMRVDGTVPQGGDRSLVYVDSDVDPESDLSTVPGVDSVRRPDGESGSQAELSVSEQTVVDRLATHGATVERLLATPSGIDVAVTLPRTADVRSFVEALGDRYDAVELLSRRDAERTEPESVESSAVLDRLTDRQREAARTAHLAGYFEWPRTNTGEEVASAMGITQPTFNRHLRTTERKLFSALFEGQPNGET